MSISAFTATMTVLASVAALFYHVRERIIFLLCEKGHLLALSACLKVFSVDLEGLRQNDWQPMELAAAHGHVSIMRCLVSEGFPLTQEGVLRYQILAVKHNHVNVLHFLLTECSADLFALDTKNQSMWVLAAECGHVEILEYFDHEQEAASEQMSLVNQELVIQAVLNDRVEVLDFLRQKNARNLHCCIGEHRSLLQFAVAQGKCEVLRYLAGLNDMGLHELMHYGYDLLYIAVKYGQVEMARVLCEEYDFDLRCTVPGRRNLVTIAAMYGHLNLLRFLQERVPDIDFDLLDDRGWGPINYAVYKGDLECLSFLHEVCHVPLEREHEGSPSLLLQAADGSYSRIVEYLHRSGVCMTVVDEGGLNVAQRLVLAGDFETLRYLHENQAVTFDGSLFECAIHRDDASLMIFLHEVLGLSFAYRNLSGATVLTLAAQEGAINTFCYLYQRAGFDLLGAEQVDFLGRSPFYWAVYNGQLDICEEILSLDLPCEDLLELDGNGQTILSVAAECGHLPVFQSLYDVLKESLSDQMISVAFSCAVSFGHLDIVRFCLRVFGALTAILQTADDPCLSVMEMALMSGDRDLVVYFMREARVPIPPLPLHQIVEGSQDGGQRVELLRFMIETIHCDPTETNTLGQTPEELAAYYCQLSFDPSASLIAVHDFFRSMHIGNVAFD